MMHDKAGHFSGLAHLSQQDDIGFHVENLLHPPDISFSAFYVFYSVCWPPVGLQDIRT